jgi:hypothetical protein
MSNLNYFNLAIPASKRLAMMRADYASHGKRYPNCPEYVKPDTWRKVRGYGLHNYAKAFGTCHSGPDALYSFDRRSIPVRSIIDAHEIEGSGMRHTGYYADSNQDQGLIIPIVARLSHGRFLSGYRWTDNGQFTIFTSTVFDDESEAARDADHEADKYAEECRESNERFDAMSTAESLVEDRESDLRSAWANYRAAVAAVQCNPARFADHVDHCRAEVKRIIEELRDDRREFDDAKQAYERV